jgi:hypothetical protein
MAGLEPATHVFLAASHQDMDGREKPGNDAVRESVIAKFGIMRSFVAVPVQSLHGAQKALIAASTAKASLTS